MFKKRSLEVLHNTSAELLTLFSSRKFTVLLVVWFAIQVLIMAVSTAKGFAPDEGGQHLHLIKAFAEDGLDPFLSKEIAGSAYDAPSYLYHYLMSFPYRLLVLIKLEPLIIPLRVINSVFAIGGVIFFVKVLRQLKLSGLVQNFALLMMTNTLMFVFISGMLNYDNLLFLWAMGSIYYFVRLYQKFTLTDLFMFSSIMMLAMLTKYTFAPIAIPLLVVLGVRYITSSTSLKTLFLQYKKYAKPVLIACALVWVVLFGLVAERYVGNVIQYGTYKPKCDQVQSFQTCFDTNKLFVRNLAFRDNPVNDYTPSIDFVYKWTKKSRDSLLGILGHSAIDPGRLISNTTLVLFAIGTLVFIRKVSWKPDKKILILLAVGFIYIGTVLFHNHTLYQKSDHFGLALQGRYLIPALPLLYLGLAYYIEKGFKKFPIILAALVIISSFAFLYSSLPSYILNTSSVWHTTITKEPLESAKRLLRLNF